jgi:hypothetical protein
MRILDWDLLQVAFHLVGFSGIMLCVRISVGGYVLFLASAIISGTLRFLSGNIY